MQTTTLLYYTITWTYIYIYSCIAVNLGSRLPESVKKGPDGYTLFYFYRYYLLMYCLFGMKNATINIMYFEVQIFKA